MNLLTVIITEKIILLMKKISTPQLLAWEIFSHKGYFMNFGLNRYNENFGIFYQICSDLELDLMSSIHIKLELLSLRKFSDTWLTHHVLVASIC